MTPAEMRSQLDELLGRPDSSAGNAVRLAALEGFSQLGLPDRRIETWRYTDIASLGAKEFSFVAPVPDSATLERVSAFLDSVERSAETQRLVFVDGHLVAALSSAANSEGFSIESCAPETENGSESTGLMALNTAFAPGENRLRFAGKAQDPLELLFIGTGRGLAPQLKLRLELEADASATIVQRFIDLPDAGEAWLNLVTEIDLSRDSELKLYRVQMHEQASFQTSLLRAELADGARLTAGNVELGGALVRNELEIALAGTGAEADVYSLSLTKDRQHADTRIAVDHRAPQTTSHQNQRAILDGASRAVFNGKVVVQRQAQHIEARQRSDSLLLSARAEADTKPELEIYADQVICSHGATVGELSEDHLFYLRARGIDAATARGILTAAFADTILGRIELESLRDEVRRAVSERLPRKVDAA